MIKTLFYTATFLCCGMAASAQSKPAAKKPASTSTTATKQPLRFRTTWGIYLSDTLPRNEVVKLLDSSLVVRDNHNNKFPVISFDFTYETKEPYMNDTTNQIGFYSDFTGDSFKDNKLPQLWRTRLKDGLQRREVLFFSNIIIKYTGDKFYRVPDMRIVVQ